MIHKSGKDIPVSDVLLYSSLLDTYICSSSLSTLSANASSAKYDSSRLACSVSEQSVLEYWNHRDELSFEEGLIFRGQTIVIPKSLRAEMLKQVHTGHSGVTKTFERAKDSIFWPGVTKEIQVYVLHCARYVSH